MLSGLKRKISIFVEKFEISRNTIVNFAQTKGLQSYATASSSDQVPFKMMILDEADAMTKDAQNALRRCGKLGKLEI